MDNIDLNNTLPANNELSIFMPLKVKRRGGHKMIIVPEGKEVLPENNVDQTLLKALVRAHLWQRQLRSGKFMSMQELCRVHKVTPKYVQLILRINLLAPKIKEAIIKGEQPKGLKLADIIQNVPILWNEQQEIFL
jgi:hypothetical protein